MRIKKITMALTLTGTVLAGGAVAAAPAGAAAGHLSVGAAPSCFGPDCSWGDHAGGTDR